MIDFWLGLFFWLSLLNLLCLFSIEDYPWDDDL